MRFVTRKALSRRTFLRGGGAALALPFLEAMTPALSAQSARPALRLGFVYIGMGYDGAAPKWEERWTPQEKGRLTQLSPSLSSLQPFLNQVNVI